MMEKKDGRTEFYRSTKYEKSSWLYSQVPQRTKRMLGINYNQWLQLLEQAELKHNEL